ncbi:MAG: hypothetical protein Q8T13_05150 [Acidobacteriota bacterium]|nr:hypothetical protein [Acidobacteriota bacterium]
MLKITPIAVGLSFALQFLVGTPSDGGPIRVAVPGHAAGDVLLIGVETIDTPECAGVVEKEVALWNIRTKVVPDSTSAEAVYVEAPNGITLNERAAWTGCARVSGNNFDRSRTLRSAWMSAQTLSRGFYAVRAVTAAELAALKGLSSPPASVATGAGWTGSGSKDTESFEMSGEWRIVWSAVPSSSVGGVLSVTVHNANDNSIVNTMSSGRISTATQDQSVVRTPPGRYYLSINSANMTWRVAVSR